jgi:ABC-2 type transport system permease protein
MEFLKMINSIFKKEFLQLKRDPRLIGLIVVMPIVLLILFGVALKLEPKNVNMAYVDESKSFFSNLIKTQIWSEGYFHLYEVDSAEQIIEEIRAGRAKAGLYIKQDFSEKIFNNEQPHVQFYVDGTMPSLTTAMKYNSRSVTDDNVTNDMYFYDDVDSIEVVIAEEPFVMDTEILFNPDEKETWYFLPGIVGVLIMQVSLILTGITIVREREKNTMEMILVSPITKIQFVLGKLIPYILICLIDFYFILGIGWTIFDLPQPSSFGLLFLLSILFVVAMISLGLFISLISKTQQHAMFIAIFIIVPSILLSGFIFPLEAINEYIRFISYAIPFTYFVDIMRGILVKQTAFADMMIQFSALAGFVVFFVSISVFKFRKTV